MFVFKDPWVLIFALLAPILIIIALWRRTGSSFTFSSGELLEGYKPTVRQRLSKIPIFLRSVAALLVLLALARPQQVLSQTRTVSEGVDIVLAIDTSTSMLAEDFPIGGKRESRLQAVKGVVRDFVRGR